MAKRKDEREEEQDKGTKAEHGIGRPDAEMEHRGTKAELGGDDDTTWLKDPKAESADVDVGPMRPTGPDQGVERPIWQEPRPLEGEGQLGAESAGIDVGPVAREAGDQDDTISAMPIPSPMPAPDEGDPAAIIWPEFQEGPEMVDDDNDDADWAEDGQGTEVQADVDVDTDEEVDTFEEVDVDDEEEYEI